MYHAEEGSERGDVIERGYAHDIGYVSELGLKPLPRVFAAIHDGAAIEALEALDDGRAEVAGSAGDEERFQVCVMIAQSLRWELDLHRHHDVARTPRDAEAPLFHCCDSGGVESTSRRHQKAYAAYRSIAFHSHMK